MNAAFTPSTSSAATDKPFAVVTGASSGIGYELAKQFASNGFNLLITATGPKIAEAAQSLQALGATVETVQADLATAEGVEKLHQAIQTTAQTLGRPLDAIAINAGIGNGGDFARETSLEKELTLIDLNVRSTVHLAKLVLKDMVARNHGRVLFTSSIAATQPAPREAVYAASKAFVQSFAEALQVELKDTAVTITTLNPGPTNTNFFARAGMADTKLGSTGKLDSQPDDVAEQGFKALMAGDKYVFAASTKTKLQGIANKFLPDNFKAEQHLKMARPGSAE